MRIGRAEGISQWEKVLATKLENMSSTPRTSIKVEGKNQLLQAVL